VTREEAANELQSYADSSWGGLNKAFELAIAALREQPRWISVEERLPELCGHYIVVVKYNHKRDEKEAVTDIDIATWGETVSLVTGIRTFEWTSMLNDWDEGNGAEITHWMPLPEPPKEEV
jgi:hypothetical protein